MIARAQMTIRDDNDLNISTTAPSAPVMNELWLDTSVTPNLLKRWNGTTWVSCGAEPAGNEIVVGTQTSATGAWTGIAALSELRDGQQITYWLPVPGSGNATLTLTLNNGTVTEAIPCYYGGLTRLTTHYPAGSAIAFAGTILMHGKNRFQNGVCQHLLGRHLIAFTLILEHTAVHVRTADVAAAAAA